MTTKQTPEHRAAVAAHNRHRRANIHPDIDPAQKRLYIAYLDAVDAFNGAPEKSTSRTAAWGKVRDAEVACWGYNRPHALHPHNMKGA